MGFPAPVFPDDGYRLVWLEVDGVLFAAVVRNVWLLTEMALWGGRTVPWRPFTECG
jgi:hypothetical protein